MDSMTIVSIHEYLTEFFEGSEDPIRPPGIKNWATIESAAGRPHTTVGGEDAYQTDFLKAAALFHSVASNHSFHNGNKRAALLSTLYFLSERGLWLDRCSDDEMYEFTRRLAAHELCEARQDEIEHVAIWLERNSRRQVKGEKPLKWSELKEALQRFGFGLEADGKQFNIYKDGNYIASVKEKGRKGMEDYDPPYISELRKRLQLTPENGVDSSRFYGHKGLAEDLNTFMTMRIDVMRRLARI